MWAPYASAFPESPHVERDVLVVRFSRNGQTSRMAKEIATRSGGYLEAIRETVAFSTPDGVLVHAHVYAVRGSLEEGVALSLRFAARS